MSYEVIENGSSRCNSSYSRPRKSASSSVRVSLVDIAAESSCQVSVKLNEHFLYLKLDTIGSHMQPILRRMPCCMTTTWAMAHHPHYTPNSLFSRKPLTSSSTKSSTSFSLSCSYSSKREFNIAKFNLHHSCFRFYFHFPYPPPLPSNQESKGLTHSLYLPSHLLK